jgi:hypothetical protein
MGMLVKAAQTLEGLMGKSKAKAMEASKSGEDRTEQVKAAVKDAGGRAKGAAQHIKDSLKGD